MNIKLKIRILETYRFQSDFARLLGITDDRLSKIIHNKILPPQDQKNKIAKKLTVKPEEIFRTDKQEV